jgi:hypothetical protein
MRAARMAVQAQAKKYLNTVKEPLFSHIQI